MIQSKPIKLIATYGRVSTARQEEEETIRTQMSAVKEHAAKNGYEIVAEYIDEGWSGTILARPELDRLRNDAKNRLWDAVLIYDPDRLARRGFYQELVIDELEQLEIPILFVTMPLVTNDEDKLMFGVRGVFAEYERTKIAERFRLGKIRKAKEGNIVVSEAPYGYTLAIRVGKRGEANFSETHYVRNEEEARVVAMIFTWIADEGYTIRKVVQRLHQEGILPRKSKRGVWSTSTLSTLIRNRSYIGEGHYGSSYAVVPETPLKKDGYRKIKKSSRKMRPQEEWIMIPVPAIFDDEAGRDLFARAQAQLKINSTLSQRNKKNQYLLGGKFRCICSRSRSGEGPKQGKYLYYRCTGRVHSYPLPPTCLEKGVNARIADNVVWSQLLLLMTSGDLMLKEIQRWKERRYEKTQVPTADIDGLKRQIAKLREQEDRYEKAYGAGLFTVEKLKEHTSPIKEKITSLDNQIAKAQTTRAQFSEVLFPEPGEIEEFAASMVVRLQNLNYEQKRAIIMRNIDKVVGIPGRLQVYGAISITNYVEFFTSDRDRGSSQCR